MTNNVNREGEYQMSAYIVSTKHIDAIMGFVSNQRQTKYLYGKDRHWDITGRRELEEIAQILLDENYRSVNERYKEDDKAPKYRFAMVNAAPSPIQVIKLVQSLEYQSCESKDWETTQAYVICQSIKSMAIRKLPGYD